MNQLYCHVCRLVVRDFEQMARHQCWNRPVVLTPNILQRTLGVKTHDYILWKTTDFLKLRGLV